MNVLQVLEHQGQARYNPFCILGHPVCPEWHSTVCISLPLCIDMLVGFSREMWQGHVGQEARSMCVVSSVAFMNRCLIGKQPMARSSCVPSPLCFIFCTCQSQAFLMDTCQWNERVTSLALTQLVPYLGASCLPCCFIFVHLQNRNTMSSRFAGNK